MKRKEAIKWVDNRMCWGRGTFTTNHPPNIDECWEAGRMAIEALSNKPYGEWIETTSGTICSNCGKYPYDDGEYHVANWHSDFCPSCGADMGQEK